MTSAFKQESCLRPSISASFYGGYIFYKTIRNPGPIVATPSVNAIRLRRETQTDRQRVLAYDPQTLREARASQLRLTLSYALRELAIESVYPVNDKGRAEVQRYLVGPVETAGKDFAQQLGWLKGACPDNPFRSEAVVNGVWSAMQANKRHLPQAVEV